MRSLFESSGIAERSCEDWVSLVVQMVRNLSALQETQVQSLGWEDPLEKGMATHFSILSWRIAWTEELGGLQTTGLPSQT